VTPYISADEMQRQMDQLISDVKRVRLEDTAGLRRNGPWIQTHTGRAYPLAAPIAEDVCIEDVAFALAHSTRFNGHAGSYSIAQHSVHVAETVLRLTEDPSLAFVGLMHDAHEAYVGDCVSPLKALLPFFREVERLSWEAVAEHFGLPLLLPAVVRHADLVLLATEVRDFLGPGDREWDFPMPAPLADQKLCAWRAQTAREMFMAAFERLRGSA